MKSISIFYLLKKISNISRRIKYKISADINIIYIKCNYYAIGRRDKHCITLYLIDFITQINFNEDTSQLHRFKFSNYFLLPPLNK